MSKNDIFVKQIYSRYTVKLIRPRRVIVQHTNNNDSFLVDNSIKFFASFRLLNRRIVQTGSKKQSIRYFLQNTSACERKYATQFGSWSDCSRSLHQVIK